jgi:hypothetical protein
MVGMSSEVGTARKALDCHAKRVVGQVFNRAIKKTPDPFVFSQTSVGGEERVGRGE